MEVNNGHILDGFHLRFVFGLLSFRGFSPFMTTFFQRAFAAFFAMVDRSFLEIPFQRALPPAVRFLSGQQWPHFGHLIIVLCLFLGLRRQGKVRLLCTIFHKRVGCFLDIVGRMQGNCGSFLRRFALLCGVFWFSHCCFSWLKYMRASLHMQLKILLLFLAFSGNGMVSVSAFGATTPCPAGFYQHTFILLDFNFVPVYSTFCIPNSETPAQFWAILYPVPVVGNALLPFYRPGDLWLQIVSAVPAVVFHTSGTMVALNCHGLVVGTSYTLFQTVDLAGGSWSNRLEFVATDETQTIGFFNPASDQCFFRLWGATRPNRRILIFSCGLFLAAFVNLRVFKI